MVRDTGFEPASRRSEIFINVHLNRTNVGFLLGQNFRLVAYVVFTNFFCQEMSGMNL
jgi:hypothetical protein